MPVLKSRPRLNVRAPRLIVPGEPFEVALDLDLRRETPVESIVALLIEKSFLNATRSTLGAPHWSAEHGRIDVLGRTTLPPGRSSYRLPLRVPASAAPSFSGRYSTTIHALDVRVSIPWWPDRHAAYQLHVGPPRPDPPEQGKAMAVSTAPEGPVGHEPYVEVSVGNDIAAGGEIVRGAFALGNGEHVRWEHVEVSLVGRESILRNGRCLAQSIGYRWRFAERSIDTHLTLGHEVPFELLVPEVIQGTGAGPTWAWEWSIEVQGRAQWARNVTARVPITIRPAGWLAGSEGTDARPARAAPTIGSDRIRAIWQSAGASNWLTLTSDDRLVGSHQGADVVIRREHRGRRGFFLVGELTYPSLHLDLDVRPAGALRRYLGRSLTIGAPELEKAHRITGRHASQVTAVLDTGTCRALGRFELLFLDDTWASVLRRDSGQSQKRLADFVREVIDLAGAITLARANIPPPPALSAGLAAWQGLAARLGGPLETARMAVEGRLHGRHAVVRTEWTPGGAPRGTHIALAAEPPLENDYTFRADAPPETGPGYSSRDPLDALPLGRWPADARALLAALLEGAATFEVTPEQTAMMLPGVLLDPAPALERLDLMARLQMALRTARGPYR